jgi:hypothetical protein
MHPLAVDRPTLALQEDPDAPIAIPWMALGQDGRALDNPPL